MTAPLAPITAPVPLPLPPHSRSQMEVNTAITPEASKPLPLNFSPSFDCLSMAPPPIVRGEKRVMTSKGRWEVDKQDYLIYTDYEEVDAPVRPVVAEKTKLVSPGDVQIQPNAKIIFNAPFDVKHIYFVKIINASERRIGWAVKKTSMKHVNVTPACGVLDARENVRLSVSCDVFDGQRVPNKDRLTVVWTITPIGVDKKFRREWLQKDGIIRRKNLPIEYNP